MLSALEIDITAAPAVASARPAPRHEFLPPEGHTTVTAVPACHADLSLVNQHDGLGGDARSGLAKAGMDKTVSPLL